MPYLLQGRPISPDRAFTATTANGDVVQFPANWIRLASEDEKAAIGLTFVPDAPQADQRFYWGYDADGNLLPKDHTQLVEQWTQQTRTTANTLLQPTDWVIIREADNGAAADPLLKVWRQDVRFAAGEKVTAIEATADTTELAAYITGAEYSTWPADPYAPQPTPDPSGDDTIAFSGGATTSAFSA